MFAASSICNAHLSSTGKQECLTRHTGRDQIHRMQRRAKRHRDNRSEVRQAVHLKTRVTRQLNVWRNQLNKFVLQHIGKNRANAAA